MAFVTLMAFITLLHLCMSNLGGEAVNPFQGNSYYNMLKELPKFATAKVNGPGLEKYVVRSAEFVAC